MAFFEFARLLGVESGEARWDIPLSGDARAFARRHIDGPAPALIISPVTGQRLRNYRNWRAERYAAVADYASRRYGAGVLLCGGGSRLEADYGREICRRARCGVVNLIGKTTLKQLLALLERATVLLCPDSGPAHMATAVGTPVVGLYATSNRHRTGPYLSRHLVADRYPMAVAQAFGRGVDEVRWGRRVRDPGAMDLISVADVERKLDAAFSERGLSPGHGPTIRHGGVPGRGRRMIVVPCAIIAALGEICGLAHFRDGPPGAVAAQPLLCLLGFLPQGRPGQASTLGDE